MNFPLIFVSIFHIPMFEIHLDKTEAGKQISDLESQAAMDKHDIHLGIDQPLSNLSAEGIGSISLWRRRYKYINTWIQAEELAVYLVTFVKSIEVLLDVFQLLSGYLGWLHRLHIFRVNPINMLQIAETRTLKDNIDARSRRVFLLGNCCIVSPTVVRLISIEFLRTVEETL